jgi:scyllo-inosamine-4-phosphate amidinotransferase 1
MIISSYNEWDPLKSIVVGQANYANWPLHDPVFKEESKKTTWTETPVPGGPVPQWIIDEANEDLQALSDTLTNLNVDVYRPTDLNFQTHDGMYNYCPRDRFIVHGSTIIDPVMMYPCRDMESQCYHSILEHASEIKYMPRDQGMVLDAANVCRLGDTWLFLESWSGNRAAYNWLCDQLPDVNIELVNFYAGVHIDSIVVPLRDGLVLLNSARVKPDNVPNALKDWDIIWVDEVVEQGFYQYPYASKWIAMNMLAVDPSIVIIDRHQTKLIQELEQRKITCIPLELRHSRTLGGGFHCVTLDLHRQST